MNILFINPPNFPFSSSGILIEPIDVIHLASFIKSLNYKVEFLDMDVKKLEPIFLESFLTKKNFNMAVIPFDYHIPLHNEETNKNIFDILNILKKFNIISVLGGKIATYYSDEQLLNWPADFFIKHDMEIPLRLLIESMIKKTNHLQIPNLRIKKNNEIINTIYKKQTTSINEFPIPDRNICDLNNYIDVRTILSSRGCNLKCTFCHVPQFWGGWNDKTPTLVCDEISLLQKQFNAKKILFLDDNALAKPNRMNEISNLLIQNNNAATLGCLGTIVSFNQNIMENMFKAGFRWIHYGAESANPIQLSEINKKIDLIKMKNILSKTKQIGFRVRTSWILDLPGLTEEGILLTEKFIIENPTDEIRLHFLTLRLGSELHKKYPFNTRQFIHNSTQNINISGVSAKLIEDSLNRILIELKKQGYVVIYNPDDFICVEELKKKSEELKIVALCPIRYGLNWI